VKQGEFQKFDAVMRKVLAVSHDELQKREKAWKRKQARKKRTKVAKAVKP